MPITNYTPSYGSSINPPVPVSFPSVDDDSDDSNNGLGAIDENNRIFEELEAEGSAPMDAAAAAQFECGLWEFINTARSSN